MRHPKMSRTVGAASALAIASVIAVSAQAQSPAEFYAGKKVTLYIGYGLGGTYGKSSTLIANGLKKEIKADSIIIQSMPGAGGLKMTNYVYNVAPKDGSALLMPPDTLVITQLLKPKAAKYQSDKFTWIGGAVRSNSLAAIRTSSGIKSWKDLKNKSVPFASSGVGSQTFQIPALINGLLGTKIQIVKGYKGSRKMLLAMEQGEVAGINLTWLSFKTNRKKWFDSGYAIPVIQMGPKAEPELRSVPLLRDLVKDEDKPIVDFMSTLVTIGRGLALPPGVPKDRADYLTKAFAKVVNDPAFQADMKKRKLEVTPSTAAEIQQTVGANLKISKGDRRKDSQDPVRRQQLVRLSRPTVPPLSRHRRRAP